MAVKQWGIVVYIIMRMQPMNELVAGQRVRSQASGCIGDLTSLIFKD